MTFYDDKAATINALVAAVEAIETELGIVPAGVYADVRTRLDILEARINNPFAPAPDVLNPFFIGNTGVTIQAGFGDPNQVLAVPPDKPGSLFLREDGYNDQGLYSFRPDGYWHQIDTDPFTAACDLSGSIYCQTVVGLQNHAINPDASLLQTDAEGDGYVLTWNETANGGLGWWEPQIGFFAAGDLAGNKIFQTVVNLQGNKLSVASPTDGYVITWNDMLDQWEPQHPAVTFDPLDNPSVTNIRSNRQSTQSPINNTKTGIVNFGSDSTQSTTGVNGNYSSILGGDVNQITADYAVIAGGAGNVISASAGFGDSILGGTFNVMSLSFGGNSIVGGSGNVINLAENCFVGAGLANNLSGLNNAIIAGQSNNISPASISSSVIIAGQSNFIGTGTPPSVVPGTGTIDSLILNGNGNSVQGPYNTVINGSGNVLTSASFNSIVNGTSNTIEDGYCFINGLENHIFPGTNKYVTVAGDFNQVQAHSHYTGVWGCNITTADGYIAAFGHDLNLGSGSTYADIHGRVNTTASPFVSIWGDSNTIGTGDDYSAIFGTQNTINNGAIKSYVWGTSNTVGANAADSWLVGGNNSVAASSAFGYAWGQNNQVAGNYPSAWGNNNIVSGSYDTAWGQNNNVSALLAGYSNVWGSSNTLSGDYSSAYGSNNNVSGYWCNVWGQFNTVVNNVSYANVFGYYGSARIQGQFVQSGNTPNGNAGAEQYSKVILDGTGASGAAFNLGVAGTINPITLEDGKVYDATIRIVMTQTAQVSGSTVAASFVFDMLAHQDAGTAVIDVLNTTLSEPNGTGWSVNISTSTNTIVISVPSYSTPPFNGTRRAVATIEWRELSRM